MTPGETIFVVCWFGGIAIVYILPSLVALFTRHPAALGIGFLNLLLGWTVVGWVAAFIWAFIKPSKPVVIQNFPDVRPQAPPPIPERVRPSPEEELGTIQRLKDAGLISEEEFSVKRAKIVERI